jgi:tRNA(Arg) A34 adenosine deaminase TadA
LDIRLTEFFKIVSQQCELAITENEIPIAALVYDPIDFKIIAYDHNRELSSYDPTAHAEILAIRKSCNILKQKRLDGYCMIVSVAPCFLCLEAIKSARIKEIHYFYPNDNPERKNISKTIMIKHEWEGENLLKKFFKEKRLKE